MMRKNLLMPILWLNVSLILLYYVQYNLFTHQSSNILFFSLILLSLSLSLIDDPSDFKNSTDDQLDSRILLFIFAFTCLLLLSTLIMAIVWKTCKRDEIRSNSGKNLNTVKQSTDDTCKQSKSDILMASSLECDVKSDSHLALTMNQHHSPSSLSHPFSSSHNQILSIGQTPFSHLQVYSNDYSPSNQSKWIILHKNVNPDVVPQGK